MKYIRIALRNLSRQKKRSFLLGGAIAFGILVIITLNAFTSGLAVNIQENLSHFFAGHIFISGMELTESGRALSIIRDDAVVKETLEELDTPYKSIVKRSSFMGSLIFGRKSILQKVDGVDWDKESDFEKRLMLIHGTLDDLDDPQAIVLSKPMADKLNVRVGENLLVKMRTVTGQQNVGEFRLAAITVDPGILGSISAYANLDYVNQLLNIKADEYQSFSIFLEDTARIDSEASRIYQALSVKTEVFPQNAAAQSGGPMGGMRSAFQGQADNSDSDWEGTKYQLLTINDMLSGVLVIIDLLDTIGIVVLVILLLIIMVGITNTFRMVMYERIGEIGTMRALGMQRSGIRNIFLLEALSLALASALAGIILALLVTFGLSLISFDSSSPFFLFMKNGHPYFKMVPQSLVNNILIVAALTLGAAFFPARKASRLEPADALRAEY